MSRRRRTTTFICALIALFAVGAPAAGGALAESPAPKASGAPTRTPIKHFVMVMQDHRSFDHYFGTRKGVDGLPENLCLPAGSLARCAAPFHLTSSAGLTAFNDGKGYLGRQINSGRMDGFVTAYANTAADGRLTMGYYDRRNIPYYWRLADEYVLFDHFFTPMAANGVPTRYLAMTGAEPPGGATTVPADGWPDIPTIADRMNAAGVSWKVYVDNYDKARKEPASVARLRARVPLLAMQKFAHPASLRGHVVDLEQYYSDAADNRLPAVSYIVATGPTERPPSLPRIGERFVRALVTTLQASPSWSSSALLLTYDSSGGWYDHVPPPAWRGRPRGARVPALLVSPFARPGVVDADVLDVATELRFIEGNWGLAPLTPRDASANSMLPAFDFTHARAADIATARAAKSHLPSPTLAIYVIYGFAVTLIVGLVVWLRRRPPAALTVTAPSTPPRDTAGSLR